MSIENHAFISYAHIDNKPLREKGRGWVEVLHGTLQTIVSQQYGREVRIWRDRKLQGNDDFSEEITDQLPRSAVMVSVISPRYLESEWCQREVKTFCDLAETSGGLFVGNAARIFKVIKTPPLKVGGSAERATALPPALERMTGYEFFVYDREQADYTELDPAYGETEEQEFLRKTRLLAGHIAKMLAAIDHNGNGNGNGDAAEPTSAALATAPATGRPVIYVNECSRFHRANRERIVADLVREGYTVLPEMPLPTDEIELAAEVESLLARSQLSVHLIGPTYGMVPEGKSGKSIGIWQNELAARRAQDAKSRSERFARVIWLAEGTVGDRPEQQGFIDALHNDAQAQFGADLVTGDIEAFKSAIRAALQRLQQPAAAPDPSPQAAPAEAPASGHAAAAAPALVYLVCDERDRPAAMPLLKALVASGCDAKLPVFRGEPQALREAHEATLAAADAVVLFHGAGDELWRRQQETDIRQAASQRGERPWRACLTYLAAPATDDKQTDVDLGRPGVIDGLKGADATAIASLLRALGISADAT